MHKRHILITFLLLLAILLDPQRGSSGPLTPQKCTVLIVMSYHEEYYWSTSQQKAIEQALAPYCTPVFFYLDSKRDFQGTPQKAKEAFALFSSLNPLGVIASDDNAQTFFVLPYLKNKTRLPVVFCGVNAEPDAYGYPDTNITGVIERAHIAETIALSRKLDPGIQSILFMTPDNPTGHAMSAQARSAAQALHLSSARFRTVSTWKEITILMDSLGQTADAVFLLAVEGVTGSDGEIIPLETLMSRFTNRYRIPVLSDTSIGVANGALCTVEQSGEEQGRIAAAMLLRILGGTPIEFLPIARNHEGKRYVNVTAIKRLDVHPRPSALRGTTLMKTKNQSKSLH